MSASIGLSVEGGSAEMKIKEITAEAQVGGKESFPNAQTQKALSSSVNKCVASSIATTHTQTYPIYCGNNLDMYRRDSLPQSPVPPTSLPSPLFSASASLPSLKENYIHTKSKFDRSGLNSDSVCQESCSRREFDNIFLSTISVENIPHSSVSVSAVSTSTLSSSSSSSLLLSSSSPSICCYTIAGHGKNISKKSNRTSPYGLSDRSHEQKFTEPYVVEHVNSHQLGYRDSLAFIGKRRSSAIPKSIKSKVPPPPVPPKPSKNTCNNNNKNKSNVRQLIKKQEKYFLDSSYNDATSFRRKLQKFEKHKSKNNVTRASNKVEDDQGDERCEFLGCFSAGNSTNSDHSISDSSCIGREQDCNIVYTAITRSNNSTNNINNNNNSHVIDIEHPAVRYGREWRVNDGRKDSIRSLERTLRYDSFGRLKSVNHCATNLNQPLEEVYLKQVAVKQPLSELTISAALPTAVVIRKLTPKLSRQTNFRTKEITSQRCASDDNLTFSCMPYNKLEYPHSHHIQQRKNTSLAHSSSSILSPTYNYPTGSNSSFSDAASVCSPSIKQIDESAIPSRNCNRHYHQQYYAKDGNSKNIFKSSSDTNSVCLSKSVTSGQLIGVRENFGSYSHSACEKDVQDCTFSEFDIGSGLNYLSEQNSVCECSHHEVDVTQCNLVNNECPRESCLCYKIARYQNNSSTDSQYQTLIEDNSNSSELSNLQTHIDTTDSLSVSSSSSYSLNLSSPTLLGPLVSQQASAIESFGYTSQNNASGAINKEVMMEKRRNTLDRWQRLGFGRRSSPTSANQERSKKSTDKSERLKELTELLRGNRSSPTLPPIPPPRKSRNVVSASNSLEKNDETALHHLSTQSDEILLMDQDEENVVGTSSNSRPSYHTNVAPSSGNDQNPQLSEKHKPSSSLSDFAKLVSSREASKSPPPSLAQVTADITTKLSRPESRTVIGSYARKGIPFRSASFSQIDYSSGNYIGATLIALRDRLRRDKTAELNTGQTASQEKPKAKSEEIGSKDKTESSFKYIPLKKTGLKINLNTGEEEFDKCTPEAILEEDIVPIVPDEDRNDEKLKETIDVSVAVTNEDDLKSEQFPSFFDKQKTEEDTSPLPEQLSQVSEVNENLDIHESNLATLVEEEFLLESPPDNFLQTATTCLIPVPVYECAAQEWNLENPPHEWVDVAPDEFGIYPEPIDTIASSSLEVPSEKGENDQTILENVPIISVSQHTSTQLEENEFEVDSFPDKIPQHTRVRSNQEGSVDYTEVKKRYSHDDMEIGNEKRSSLDCSLQRLCSNAEERKRIDKSKRRKGMYIESTDWVESSKVRNSRGMDLDVSLLNFNTIKAAQSNECSSILYLNSPGIEDNQNPGSQYSLDFNTPESECNKPPIWTNARRTSLSCQSSEEKVDEEPMSQISYKSQSFPCTESVSDNESDRAPAPSRDRSSPSPALSDQDFKRYSKRPLRGPYGQMLEAEMKKPNRLHFEEILEELKDPDMLSVRRTRGGHHDTRSFEEHPRITTIPQYSNSFRVRKSNMYLPLPTHTRAASTPSQIENVTRSSGLPKVNSLDKRYQSTLDNSISADKKSYSDMKRVVSNATSSRPIHAKSSSLVPLDKQTKRSTDELRILQSSRSPSERSVATESNDNPGHGNNLMPTPELLAELLQGASEKLISEQRQQMFADTRTHVVQEIFRNEQSYVESLQTVVLKYFKVLKTPEHAGMIDTRTVDEIFFMVPDILTIHEKFLGELKSRLDSWEPQQKVGDAFIETFSKTEVLEVYTSFVNNCNRAKNAIRTTKQSRPSFARFLETTAREHKGKLTLDNLLIKPVQKFPNYEMLFTRLIKHTDGDHPDQKHLQEVLKLVHDILVHINCKEREILENGQREATLRELEGIIEGITELIAPDRQFLIFDLVLMPSGQGARKERGFFLFNDLLVITSIKRRSGTIRKPNTTSCPGSVASTLDTNKYKFLTKVSLDNLEIMKSKDESLRKRINEIEQLADDCNKLQQVAEVTATIKYPHQILEDVIRDLHRDVQRQLSERQSNEAQLNMLELTVNSPNGSQKLSIIFNKSEKRSQWEEAFNEAKQKLAATLERHPIPEFMTSIPIVKTRAGLQFTCAAPTLSEQKDVWVCNSDGYVGQVCVMSLSPEPNVTSCNGVCNARILCLASVPACSESGHKAQRSSLNEEISVREFRKSSSPNFNTNQSEKKKGDSSAASSDIQLDSNSSSDDSEPETSLNRERIPSPSPTNVAGSATAHHHQNQDSNPDESDGNQSTMWLGTEDGYIHVYNCTDTIRIKKNKIKIQHASAVYSILYLDNRVFVSLANGDICVYLRDSVGWNTSSPLCISIGSVSSPVNRLLNVHGKLWCSIQGIIKVMDTKTLQVVNQIQISSDSKPITNMAVSSSYVWISIQNSAHIKCFHSNTHQLVTEVNLAPAVNKMLSNCDDIIRQHKAACLRVTSLLSCKDLIWIGTSAGVLLTIPAHGFEKGAGNVMPTGIPHGHTGHVRFLTFVETSTTKNSSNKLSEETVNADNKNRRSSKHSKTKSETGNILIISGGDGYEDFRNSGANSLSEIAGREDSTNHLLIWQI